MQLNKHLRLKKYIGIAIVWFLGFNVPVAMADRFTEEKDFPPYKWIDKTPRKYKECDYGYCIKLELDQNWINNYFETAIRPYIFIRVKYYDSKKRLISTGAANVFPESKIKLNQNGKNKNPKAWYIYPTANRNVEDDIPRPVKFSNVIIGEIITR